MRGKQSRQPCDICGTLKQRLYHGRVCKARITYDALAKPELAY